MASNSWKQAVNLGIMFCALSLPLCALDNETARDACADKTKSTANCATRSQNVPEDGGPLTYSAVAAMVAVGALAMARKSRFVI